MKTKQTTETMARAAAIEEGLVPPKKPRKPRAPKLGAAEAFRAAYKALREKETRLKSELADVEKEIAAMRSEVLGESA
jgi:hypothetical protein